MGVILPEAADRAIFETPSEQIAAGVVLVLQKSSKKHARCARASGRSQDEVSSMNLETVTHELRDAPVEELAQTLRLIATRSLALHDTVVIDRDGRAVLLEIRRNADALADTLYNLALG